MSNRLTRLLIVWLTLFSVALPAMACAAVTHHGDCCPDSGQPPCGGCPERAPGPGASTAHCLSAPASVASPSASSGQIRKVVTPDLEAIALPALAAQVPTLAQPTEALRHRWHAPPGEFEAPAWLVTGRLRL